MKINDVKKLKILFYWDLGVPVSAIAVILKISENSIRKYLKKENRNGPPSQFNQAWMNWIYLNQQVGEPLLNYPSSKDDRQRAQQLTEENSALKEKITDLSVKLQIAYDREQKLTKDMEKINHEKKDLNQRIPQLTKEKETEKQEKEELQNKVNEQDKLIVKIKQKHYQELEEQKNRIIAEMEKKREEDQQKFENDLSKAKERINFLQKEVLRLEEKVKKSSRGGLVIGGICGATVGVIGTLFCQKLFSPPSNSPIPVFVDSRINTGTGHDAIPNSDKGMIQPSIYDMGSGVEFPGSPIGFGKGCGIVIPTALRKYIRQT